MIGDASPTAPPRARRRSPIVVAVQAAFALVLLAAVAGGLWSATQQAEAPEEIPPRLGELRLLRSLTGQEALANLQQLYGRGFGLTGGYVAFYENRATVWVGDTENERQAQALISAMAQRIAAGNQVFTNLEPLQVSGQTIYSVEGQGQQHLFYSQGRKTIWVAAPRGAEMAFLQEALRLVR